ncbi:MAG: DUF2279 domain-containing protein [Beijerinckiaceae bacterium]
MPQTAPKRASTFAERAGGAPQKAQQVIEADGLIPVNPLYSLGATFGGHVKSVGWELAIVGGAILVVGLRDWDWGGSSFRTIDEGWFGSDTRHGGMDKIGHAFSTYVIADILTDRIRANAANPVGAEITGALLAFGIMGIAETVDGFTGRHRFSREDIAANAVGAAFSFVRNAVPGLRQKLDFRLLYTPASYERPGITPSEFSFIPPYERQRYIMALKGSGFPGINETPLRYFELQGGFDARGFGTKERAMGYSIERSFYAGIGVNLNEVLFGAGPLPNLAGYRDTLPARLTQMALEYIQVPYTAAYYKNTFSTRPSTPASPDR